MIRIEHICLLTILLAGSSAHAQSAKKADGNREADQAIGQRFQFSPDNLPKPYATEAVRNQPVLAPRGNRQPIVPEGFEATLFADGLTNPRQILILPNGDVLVALQSEGRLMMMRDDDKDGKADWIGEHASGFNKPNGLAFREGEILVADQDAIWSVAYGEGQIRPLPPKMQPAAKVPEEERKPSLNFSGQEMLSAKGVFGPAIGHGNRDIEVGPDGRLYVGVGSAGNIGIEREPKGTVQSFSAAGKDQQTVATGVRNPTGLTFHPQTGDLWAIVQERDGMGDEIVADYFTKIKPGGFYGWPFTYIGNNPQPGFAGRDGAKAKDAIAPDLLFQPHSAAMDAVFYDKEMFPESYRGDAFVAIKGSWNRTKPTGYKVVRVKFENGKPAGWYDNFVTGFWVAGEDKAEVWGRPADVAVAPDGALFVADDSGGTIWRIAAKGK